MATSIDAQSAYFTRCPNERGQRGSRMRRRMCVWAICAFMSMGMSCPLTGSIDRAVQQIDRAITQIHDDSTRWQSVLNDLADKLRGTIDHTIQVDLTQFVERSTALVSQQTVCT